MSQREFLALLGGAAARLPVAVVRVRTAEDNLLQPATLRGRAHFRAARRLR